MCECTTNLVTLSGECVPIWSFRFTLPLIAKEYFIEFLNLKIYKDTIQRLATMSRQI